LEKEAEAAAKAEKAAVKAERAAVVKAETTRLIC
jgi:hypothetical protein